MRKIAAFFIVMVFGTLAFGQVYKKVSKEMEEKFAKEQAFLPQYLGDSLYEKEFKGHRFILLDIAHDLISWAAIVENGSEYKFFSGNSRSFRERDSDSSYWSRTLESGFAYDTVRFVKDFKHLLEWGMDTLPVLAKYMTPHECERWSPFRKWLEVVNDKGEPIFINGSNVEHYSGNDSVRFNEKLDNLVRVMWWVKFFPHEEICPYPDLKKRSKMKKK